MLRMISFLKINFPNQSRLRSGDFCINQFFSINYETLKAFDKGLQVHGIFLDISKTFDLARWLGKMALYLNHTKMV